MSYCFRTISQFILLLLLSSCLGFTGCARLLIGSKSENQTQEASKITSKNSLQRHEQLAHRYYKSGLLPEALVQWKILSTLSPGNTRYKTEVHNVEKQIDEQAEKHLRAAAHAFEIGENNVARKELLKSLAYVPTQSFPQKYLRENEYQIIHKIQLAKYKRIKEERKSKSKTKLASSSNRGTLTSSNEQEFQYLEQGVRLFRDGELRQSIIEIKKFLNSYPSDPLARQYVSDAYMGIAKQLLSNNNNLDALANFQQAKEYATEEDPRPSEFIHKTKKMIAEDFYEKGQRIFNKDADKAIEYWKRSIEYDPQHTNARLRLRTALKIKRKLNTIN